jgi:hypothetical protein
VPFAQGALGQQLKDEWLGVSWGSAPNPRGRAGRPAPDQADQGTDLTLRFTSGEILRCDTGSLRTGCPWLKAPG